MRDHADPNIVVMPIGNKSNLRHLVAISTNDGKSCAEKESLYFMEISTLEATNVAARGLDVNDVQFKCPV